MSVISGTLTGVAGKRQQRVPWNPHNFMTFSSDASLLIDVDGHRISHYWFNTPPATQSNDTC